MTSNILLRRYSPLSILRHLFQRPFQKIVTRKKNRRVNSGERHLDFDDRRKTADAPLRAELFSADQMELHARRLAAAHTSISTSKQPENYVADQLLIRLSQNETVLVDICTGLAERLDRAPVPAAEWLLDNFYLIEEQIRTARLHFPKGYSRALPRLANGPSKGLPRVYDIALEAISHGDGRIDLDVLNRFVTAYQSVTELSLGELWAIPIVLRLALIENLRRVAVRTTVARKHREAAGHWSDQMLAMAESDPKSLILVIADMARSQPPMESAFVAELARRLQGHIPASTLPLAWVEQLLAESHLTIEQLVRREAQQQAADQVSIGNSIGSLRFLGATDWREFVEAASVVEQILASDPDGTYSRMTFSTRDVYRHAVEKTARAAAISESDVARRAIDLALEASQRGEQRAAHVGFFLIDVGYRELQRAVIGRASALENILRCCKKNALSVFLGAIALATLLIIAKPVAQLYEDGQRSYLFVLLIALVLLPASRLAIELVNWLATLVTTSRALPRLDFSEGVVEAARTLVVVPTLLSSTAVVAELCEALEVRYLANCDDHIHFALLTDFLDANTETCAGDDDVLQLLVDEVSALNAKYERSDLFFLMHRPRLWNPQERVWMGHERKRGKLADLNAFLRSSSPHRFMRVVGDVAILPAVKYVITLDVDTQLPRDAARELIGAIAHPLNQARFTQAGAGDDRIVAGYAILQPGIGTNITGANASHYAQLCGGEAGIDPYTRVVADAYQNVFGEGSFVGKGIYDVDAFERALAGRIPENRILSHDLLEGCIARAGLLSDSRLFEDYPPHYGADVRRRQRWIRGDWQLAGWLWPRVLRAPERTHGDAQQSPDLDSLRVQSRYPSPSSSRYQSNPLSALSRWKILDNLLRSLNSSALLLVFVYGWLISPSPLFWTLATLAALAIAPLCVTVLHIVRKPPEILLRQHIFTVLQAAGKRFAQTVLTLACLPFDACFSLDAIVRTLVRLLITRRRLLEWRASGESERHRSDAFARVWNLMWIAPAIALALGIGIVAFAPAALPVAAPILLLWLASPTLVWWLSQSLRKAPARLTTEQLFFLRKNARRTWGFFEEFVVAEDNWLPPDNYQDYRGAVIAHRTSPTNIGLALLANLSAHDFGYIPTGVLLERTHNTLQTMAQLERMHGHFYNWYDTQTLLPLHPIYISTVDSGNLAGHLLVLRQGLCELIDQPVFARNWLDGVRDVVGIVVELSGSNHPALGRLRMLVESIDAPRATTPSTLLRDLDQLHAHAQTFAASAAVDVGIDGDIGGDAAWWAQALVQQCRALGDDMRAMLPWLALPAPLLGCDALMLRVDTAFFTANPGGAAIPTLRELASVEERLFSLLDTEIDAAESAMATQWLQTLRPLVAAAGRGARARIAAIENLAGQAHALAQMRYEFLYDASRRLLAIGYNVSERRRDTSYYDLLASEARLANFVAIAQREVPQQSWFALGHQLVDTGGAPALMSWSGSMFEYLMPLLVMPTYANTLLEKSNIAVVAHQIEYGKLRGVPWGISESGHNTVDAHFTYQYHAFGVPGLGLRRGLADDLVIAPYATALALMVAPEAACVNLSRLAALGMQGKFGFYEALDYTATRQRADETSTIVFSFMAHHQGMSLLATAFLLLGQPMQRRFAADLSLQATLSLLQERVPKTAAGFARATELADFPTLVSNLEMAVRIFDTPHTRHPEVQLLSNGRYHVMVTNAGGGYSRWNDLALTRWREDSTCDQWGTFCYLRDVASGEFWSTAHQPTARTADRYESIFSEGRAEFRRVDHEFDVHTEMVVSPEDDIELRRMHITNTASVRRVIEITSYAEVVIATAASDATHPAFSNLFVQTEIVPQHQGILCTRRPRFLNEATPWMLHLLAVHGAEVQAISYETDRREFIGRGNSLAQPAAMSVDELSGNAGSVLDPIVAIRCRIVLEPEQTATIDIVSGIGADRAAALALIAKYQDRYLADRVFDLAWTHSQVLLRQLNASEGDAQLYGRLASSILYANASLRADVGVLLKNRRGQAGLWAYAISGDLPIVLLQIHDSSNIELVRQLVQAHAYWRLKGLAVDLVIWNEDHAGYRQLLQEQIVGLIGAGTEAYVIDRPGGIFVRSADQIANEDRVLMLTVARVVISDRRGTLAEQMNLRSVSDVRIARLQPISFAKNVVKIGAVKPVGLATLPGVKNNPDKVFDNGIGGFSADGREYVITLAPGAVTPAPWANVLANPHFGTVISESGRAYTWSENAHEYRLTPWHNDAVSDGSGEALYLRDEDSGRFWSPTPLPIRGNNTYECRHGFGYSVFEYSESDIHSELTIFVATAAPIKFSLLKVRNDSERVRSLSATGFVEWVLGDLPAKTAQHVTTEIDPNSGALCARNPYSNEFAEGVAFFDVGDIPHTFTGDRREFLGRNGMQATPAALTRERLSGKVGAALDPCAALQVPFELQPGETREFVFRLGFGRDTASVSATIQKFRGVTVAHAELEAVKAYWRHTLGAVQIDTPDISLNILANGWLLYQVIASRLWARSGYYQSGGAFGFRDQLQDTMALLHTEPLRLREQLLLCASRQFIEGDVQHWWHPPSGRGVRTHCSDDYLWLPLATCRYVAGTGDTGVLNESMHFLAGRAVNAGEDSYYDLPGRTDEATSLYQHCVRAIRRGLNFGTHGLPLIGSGDWNDGMNLVGIEGRGESVWLGFFLCDVLSQFTQVASSHGDTEFAAFCAAQAITLRSNIEAHGWDGGWYRRAYFDDGTALGSAENDECQIDSISQSWSVLASTGENHTRDRSRSRLAMDAVYKRLVRRDDGLIQLLDPPFDRSPLNPGYIKGYVPGVRENGGQYTHGAIWAAMAYAALGDNARAWQLTTMINPIAHGLSAGAIETYKVEPYVMAADVYAVAPHTGRGGWSWYTGSAGWMYRLIIESLLGLRLDVDKLHFTPCLPAHWQGFKMDYRFRGSTYHIDLRQIIAEQDEIDATMQLMLDGRKCAESFIRLIDDARSHHVEVTINAKVKAEWHVA